MRTWSTIFGICLGILWIGGLSSADSATWLAWVDGAGAFCAFGIAARRARLTNQELALAGPVALSAGLFAAWIIGMATNGAPWQSWWTFVFACSFAMMGGLQARRPSTLIRPIDSSFEEEEEERKRFRRAG